MKNREKGKADLSSFYTFRVPAGQSGASLSFDEPDRSRTPQPAASSSAVDVLNSFSAPREQGSRRSGSVIVSPPSPERHETTSSSQQYHRSGSAPTAAGSSGRHQASRVFVLSRYVDELERERFLLLDEIGRLRRERDEAVAVQKASDVARRRVEDRCSLLEAEISRLLQISQIAANNSSAVTGGNGGFGVRERSPTPLPPPSTPPRTPPMSFQRREPILSPAPPVPTSVAAAIVALAEDIRQVKNRLDVTEAIQSSFAAPTSPDDSTSQVIRRTVDQLKHHQFGVLSDRLSPSHAHGTLQSLQHVLSPETVLGSPSPSPPPPSVSPPTAHVDRHRGDGNSHENVSTISSATDDELRSDRAETLFLQTAQPATSPMPNQSQVQSHLKQRASPVRPPPGAVTYAESSPDEEFDGQRAQSQLQYAPPMTLPFIVSAGVPQVVAASQRFGIAFPSPRR